MAEQEIDFSYHGLRIRTMEIVPEGGAMILDRNNELCALYLPRDGWRGSRSIRDFDQLVLSHGAAQLIAQHMRSASAPAPEENVEVKP